LALVGAGLLLGAAQELFLLAVFVDDFVQDAPRGRRQLALQIGHDRERLLFAGEVEVLFAVVLDDTQAKAGAASLGVGTFDTRWRLGTRHRVLLGLPLV